MGKGEEMKLTDESGKEYTFQWHSANRISGDLRPIKPDPKKIDMSVCIESGIDCEFSDSIDWRGSPIRKLKHVKNNGTYLSNNNNGWKYCRPRMHHTHASPTGWDKCPVPIGFIVAVWYPERETLWTCVQDLEIGTDIIAWDNVRMFQVMGIQDGWEL